MSKFHNQIEKLIKKAKRVKRYIVNSNFNKTTDLSSMGEFLGGILGPVSSRQKFGGYALIEWQDGKVSKGGFSLAFINDFEKQLDNFYETRYEDINAKNFLSKKSETFDNQESKEIMSRNFDPVKTVTDQNILLKKWMSELKETRQYSGSTINVSESTVTNSNGLEVSESKTINEIYCYMGDEGGIEWSQRKPTTDKQARKYFDRVSLIYKIVTRKCPSPKLTKKISVILDPDSFSSIFSHFIGFNISAESIYKKQSFFTLKDFSQKKSIASAKLDLIVHPRKKMKPSAGNFSWIGWEYPQNFSFIKGGKLVSPISDHRHANILKIKPTPGMDSLQLVTFGDIEQKRSLEESFNSGDESIIVTQLLGLHTQDESSGNFSLVCPKSIYIKDGKPQGSLEVMIRGNMFEIFKNLKKIYRDPLTELPYIETNDIEVVKTV